MLDFDDVEPIMLDVADVGTTMLDVDDVGRWRNVGSMMLDVGAMLNCVKKSLTAVKQS